MDGETQSLLVLLAIGAVFSVCLFFGVGTVLRNLIRRHFPKAYPVLPLSRWDLALYGIFVLVFVIGFVEMNGNPYGAVGAWIREIGFTSFLGICLIALVAIGGILTKLGLSTAYRSRGNGDSDV